jgi:hypothetical protein
MSSTASTQPGVLPEVTLPRSRRRGLVVALYATYALGVAAYFWGHAVVKPAVGKLSWGALLAGGFLAFLMLVAAIGFTLIAATRSITERRMRELDEREQQVRDAAFRPAYLVTTLLFLGALLYVTVGLDAGFLRVGHVEAMFWGMVLVQQTLPSAVVAWTEDDPPADLEPAEPFGAGRVARAH